MSALAVLPRDRLIVEMNQICPAGDRDLLIGHWFATAHGGQMPPGDDWRTWLILAGRGFGKTRAGAEWVQFHAMAAPRGTPCHIALVAANYDEARDVMVEGAAGILAVAHPRERPHWEPAKRRLLWPNGAVAKLYSGERPDGLRGGEHSFAWCDEIAKWSYPAAAWLNLQLALRQGPEPRVVVTTTPRHGPFLTGLRSAPGTIETRGATRDNKALPPGYIAAVDALYGGTRLGRQELDGEVLTDLEDALWTRETIEACRMPPPDGRHGGDPAYYCDWRRIVVAVDPPAGSTKKAGEKRTGDECGIIAAAIRPAGQIVILEDASVPGSAPHVWAAAVAACAAKWRADQVVAEANNGGQMVQSVLLAADANLPVKLVHASRGKTTRAEPVATFYRNGRVKHAGAFPELEDQLCGLTIHGYEGPGRSPDRADALVWAVTELAGKRKIAPRVRGFAPEAAVPGVRRD